VTVPRGRWSMHKPLIRPAQAGLGTAVTRKSRKHDIAESLLRKWRDQAVDAARERFEAGRERSLQSEQRRRIARLERALGRKTYELEIAGEALRGWE
jgi:transposase